MLSVFVLVWEVRCASLSGCSRFSSSTSPGPRKSYGRWPRRPGRWADTSARTPRCPRSYESGPALSLQKASHQRARRLETRRILSFASENPRNHAQKCHLRVCETSSRLIQSLSHEPRYLEERLVAFCTDAGSCITTSPKLPCIEASKA